MNDGQAQKGESRFYQTAFLLYEGDTDNVLSLSTISIYLVFSPNLCRVADKSVLLLPADHVSIHYLLAASKLHCEADDDAN